MTTVPVGTLSVCGSVRVVIGLLEYAKEPF
jgi:hypothetical protein